MNKGGTNKGTTWGDLTAFTANRSSWTDEDWAEGIRLADSLDPSTIPEGIEIPYLRSGKMIVAEAQPEQTEMITNTLPKGVRY